MNDGVFGSIAKSLTGRTPPAKSKRGQSKKAAKQDVPPEQEYLDFGSYIAGVGPAADWLCVEAKRQYEAGRRGVLMEVVFVCACIQAVIPDWAVDALLLVKRGLGDGSLNDYNEAFGKLPRSRTKRASEKNRLDHTGQVIHLLGKLRVQEGFNLSRESLELAAKRIREQGVDVSTDEVRRIYEQHGAAVRNVKIGSDGDFNSAFLVVPFEAFRRRGRPVLEGIGKSAPLEG